MQLTLRPFGGTPTCSPSPPFQFHAQSSAPTSPLLTIPPHLHLDGLPAPLRLIPHQNPSSLEHLPNQKQLEVIERWQKISLGVVLRWFH